MKVDDKSFDDIDSASLHFRAFQTWDAARTLRDVVTKALVGKELDPQAEDDESFVPQDEIVKKAEKVAEYFSAEWGKRFRAFAQAIAAKIEDVRKLFRNHEERIVEVEVLRQEIGDLRQMHKIEHDRAEGNLPYMELKMQTLERKLEELEKEIEKAHHDTAEDDSRISALEQRIKSKPQPAESPERSRRAQAPDSKGKMHDLIPGVSVYHCDGGSFEKIFHHCDTEYVYGYAVLETAPKLSKEPWLDYRGTIIWLRNLSFPGGDK